MPVRMRIRAKGKLIKTKVIDEETFKDYLAMAGTAASITNAPPELIMDIANHAIGIEAEVILRGGHRVHISVLRTKE